MTAGFCGCLRAARIRPLVPTHDAGNRLPTCNRKANDSFGKPLQICGLAVYLTFASVVQIQPQPDQHAEKKGGEEWITDSHRGGGCAAKIAG